MTNLQRFGKYHKPHIWKTKVAGQQAPIWCCTGGQNFRDGKCIRYTVTYGETPQAAYEWFMSGDISRGRSATQMIQQLNFRDEIVMNAHGFRTLKGRAA